MRLWKYVFIYFSLLNIFSDSYNVFSYYATNYTVITVIISLVQLLKQCGRNKLYHN